MKVSGITGLGAVVSLWSGQALAQSPPPKPAPPQDEEMDAPTAPAAPSTPGAQAAPGEAAPAEKQAPAEPPATTPTTDANGAHVLWKEPSADEPRAPDSTAGEATEQPAAPTPSGGWSLSGQHFALSVERMSSLIGWSKKLTIAPADGVGDSVTIETSGTDVSLLGAGALRSASGVPRVAFDMIFDGGFSIGGALSYMTSSGKLAPQGMQPGADLPDGSMFLFAPRAGVMIEASSGVGLWLRGGFTRTSISSSTPVVINGSAFTEDDTLTTWDFSLDPALVLVAAPHVAITISGLLEVGVSGTESAHVDGVTQFNPQGSSTTPTDLEEQYSNVNYGVTAGLVALF